MKATKLDARTSTEAHQQAQRVLTRPGLFVLKTEHDPGCPAIRTQRDADCRPPCRPDFYLIDLAGKAVRR